MADANELAQIRRFVRRNREKYLEQGLRKRLLEAGHTPDAIDVVLAEAAQAEDGEPPRAYFWSFVVTMIAANLLLAWQACDLMPWFLLGEIFCIVNFVRVGRAGNDRAARMTHRVLFRGCAAGFLLSLPLLALWFTFYGCGPDEETPPNDRDLTLHHGHDTLLAVPVNFGMVSSSTVLVQRSQDDNDA